LVFEALALMRPVSGFPEVPQHPLLGEVQSSSDLAPFQELLDIYPCGRPHAVMPSDNSRHCP
jgi:hypothetical protein